MGVDLSILRCKKHFRGGHIYPIKKAKINAGGAPYSSYTVYRHSLMETERPDQTKTHFKAQNSADWTKPDQPLLYIRIARDKG
jgi:hypothetical protein